MSSKLIKPFLHYLQSQWICPIALCMYVCVCLLGKSVEW